MNKRKIPNLNYFRGMCSVNGPKSVCTIYGMAINSTHARFTHRMLYLHEANPTQQALLSGFMQFSVHCSYKYLLSDHHLCKILVYCSSRFSGKMHPTKIGKVITKIFLTSASFGIFIFIRQQTGSYHCNLILSKVC